MQKPDRIGTLDGLRGYAIILVILAHFPTISFFPSLKYFSNLVSAGFLGVDIFFVLSGFLITRILLNEKLEGTFSFTNFYIKRALRIFPIYFLTVLIVGVSINWDRMGWVALYLSNYYFAFDMTPHPMRHTWSLAVEEHFYIAWPFLLRYLSLESSKKMIGAVIPALAIVSCIVSINLVEKKFAYELVHYGTHTRILSLSLGALLAFHEPWIRQLKIGVWVMLIVLAPVFLYLASSQPLFPVEMLTTWLTARLIFFAIVSTLAVIIAIRLDSFPAATIPGKLKYVFLNPLSRYIGKISYGMYLYHFPILFFLDLNTGDAIGLNGVLLLIALFVTIPTLSFYLIESPLLSLKKKFSR